MRWNFVICMEIYTFVSLYGKMRGKWEMEEKQRECKGKKEEMNGKKKNWTEKRMKNVRKKKVDE